MSLSMLYILDGYCIIISRCILRIFCTSQCPTRVHLAFLHKRPIQSRNNALTQGTAPSQHLLQLLPQPLCLLLRILLRPLPIASTCPHPNPRYPADRGGNHAHECIWDDQVAQPIPRRQQIAPQRVCRPRAVLERCRDAKVRRKQGTLWRSREQRSSTCGVAIRQALLRTFD